MCAAGRGTSIAVGYVWDHGWNKVSKTLIPKTLGIQPKDETKNRALGYETSWF